MKPANGNRVETGEQQQQIAALELQLEKLDEERNRVVRELTWQRKTLKEQNDLAIGRTQADISYVSFIAAVPLLARVGAHEQQQLADALEPVTFHDGEEIITEGDVDETIFIVEDGTAVAMRDDVDGTLAEYTRGDFFGELALLTEAPRAATVTARGTVKCLRLGRSSFQRLAGTGTRGGRGYRGARRQAVSSESTSAMMDAKRTRTARTPNPPKSAAQTARVKDATRDNILFAQLHGTQLDELVDCMTERHIAPGEVVIKQGDEGDYFYVIESGACEVYVDGRLQCVLGPGDSFGELALMHSTPRAATVQAANETTVLWAMDRVSFRCILLEAAYSTSTVVDPESCTEGKHLSQSWEEKLRANVVLLNSPRRAPSAVGSSHLVMDPAAMSPRAWSMFEDRAWSNEHATSTEHADLQSWPSTARSTNKQILANALVHVHGLVTSRRRRERVLQLLQEDHARPALFASRAVRRALLTPQANPGSRYRCSGST